MNDDKLALIAEANNFVKVAIKTPFGTTGRESMNRIVMQGEIFGPLCCSVTIDTIGKECIKEKKNLYYHKKKVASDKIGHHECDVFYFRSKELSCFR